MEDEPKTAPKVEVGLSAPREGDYSPALGRRITKEEADAVMVVEALETDHEAMKMFVESAALAAKIKEVSEKEAANLLLIESIAKAKIVAETSMTEIVKMAAQEVISSKSSSLNDKTNAFMDATGIYEIEDIKVLCEAILYVADVNGMTYIMATALLAKTMTSIEAKCLNGIEAVFMLSKTTKLIAKSVETSCNDATMLSEAASWVARSVGSTEDEVATIFTKIAANRSEGATLARDPALETFKSEMRSMAAAFTRPVTVANQSIQSVSEGKNDDGLVELGAEHNGMDAGRQMNQAHLPQWRS